MGPAFVKRCKDNTPHGKIQNLGFKIQNYFFPRGQHMKIDGAIRIISAHEGKISVKSKQNEFTAFKVVLPKEI